MENGCVSMSSLHSQHETHKLVMKNLEFIAKDNRLIWNGNVADLKLFLVEALIDPSDGKPLALTVNTNAKNTVFKTFYSTIVFHPTTKTLQFQGKSGYLLKNEMIELFNYSKAENSGDCQPSSFIDISAMDMSSMPNDVSQNEISELESFIDSAELEVNNNNVNFTSDVDCKVEINKIWEAISSINSKVEVIAQEQTESKLLANTTLGPEELRTMESLSSENELLKSQLCKMQIELQKAKEENASLISAMQMVNAGSSSHENTDDNGISTSSRRPKLLYSFPVCTDDNHDVNSIHTQLQDYRQLHKKKYETSRPATSNSPNNVNESVSEPFPNSTSQSSSHQPAHNSNETNFSKKKSKKEESNHRK